MEGAGFERSNFKPPLFEDHGFDIEPQNWLFVKYTTIWFPELKGT